MNQEDIYCRYGAEVDIKDMLLYNLYKWRSIILCSLIFCILLSTFGVVRRMSADPTLEPKPIREYRLALARYQLNVDGYKLDITNYEERMTQQKIYLEKSVLMHTDPYEKPTASADFFIKLAETEWDGLPDNINVDPTDSLIKMYTSGLNSNLDWKSIEELTGGQKIYLQELLDVKPDYSSNTFTINVVHSNGEMALQILDIITEQLMDKYQYLKNEINNHTLTVSNRALSYNIDNSLADRQKSSQTILAEYEHAILDCQEALDALEEEVPKKPFVIGFIKYPAAGFVLGILLSIIFHCTAYLAGGRLQGDEELKNRYGFPLLGVYPRQEKKRTLSCIDRFIYKLSGSCSKDDTENTNQRIALNLLNLTGNIKSVLITGSISLEKLQKFTADISPLVDNITFTAAANMNTTPKTLELLARCDAIVLVEEKNESLIREIRKIQEIINVYQKPVTGYVLLQG